MGEVWWRVLPICCVATVATMTACADERCADACGSATDPHDETGGTSGTSTGVDASDGTTASTSGDTETTGADADGCDWPSVSAPAFPSWVPPWPGEGRNASGKTDFIVFGDAIDMTTPEAQMTSATTATVRWTTTDAAASRVAWGLGADGCALGYHRTGARQEHEMFLFGLQPGDSYTVTASAYNEVGSESAQIELVVPPLPEATELDACGPIDSSGTYRLAGDVTADCTCFAIQADGVELDLGGHTIRYAQTATAEQCHGVLFDGAGSGRLTGGVVEQGDAGGDAYSHGVMVRGDEVTVDHLFVHVHTADAVGVKALFAGSPTIEHVFVVSEVTDVIDRHYPGNQAFGIDIDAGTPARIHDVVAFGFPHWGISVTGDERLTEPPTDGPPRRIYNNHLFADMHATNGYAIGIAANGFEVDHNEIRPLHNGRAIHYTRSGGDIHHNIIEAVERIAGDPEQGYAYYSDLSDPNSPHDPSVCSWVVAHGIRIESGNFGVVHENEVHAESLPEVTFGSSGLNITVPEGGEGGLEIHDNAFSTVQARGSIDCGGGLPTVAGWVRGEVPANPIVIRDNVFTSTDDTLSIEIPSNVDDQGNTEAPW